MRAKRIDEIRRNAAVLPTMGVGGTPLATLRRLYPERMREKSTTLEASIESLKSIMPVEMTPYLEDMGRALKRAARCDSSELVTIDFGDDSSEGDAMMRSLGVDRRSLAFLWGAEKMIRWNRHEMEVRAALHEQLWAVAIQSVDSNSRESHCAFLVVPACNKK